MHAPVQSRTVLESRTGLGDTRIVSIALMYIVVHAGWFILPLLIGFDVPPHARFVTGTSLALGVIALYGLWRRQAWGWWMTVVLSVVNVILAVGDSLGIEGSPRVWAIIGLLLMIATVALLFRPGVRPVKG